MKERPIIFSGPMVRAILEGRKTQARRIVKPQPPSQEEVRSKSGSGYSWIPPGPATVGRFDYWRVGGPVWAVRELMGREPKLRCPYGIPGHRLWCRESMDYRCVEEQAGSNPADIYRIWAHVYAADGVEVDFTDSPDDNLPKRYIPSIHMPRWASRITLEVCSVRIERLQEITEEDARAEGVETDEYFERQEHYDTVAPPGESIGRPTARGEFEVLWDHINAKRAPWSSNPWAWVVEFRKVEP